MEDRTNAIDLLNEGAEAGVPMKVIADLLGVCRRTLRRWRLDISGQGFSVDRRKGAPRKVAHKFTVQERQKVIDTINDPRFADLPPGQIVAILAEEQQYVGSEMTIYRIMREERLLNHRGRVRQPRKPRAVPMLEAKGIHQVLAWDITLVPGPIKGQYFYVYMVMDVWSRRILGAEVHDVECSKLASDFFDRVCRDEGLTSHAAAVLHSDNGAPMRSIKLAAKMRELGISLSFSRPGVSNDNAYAESLFKTMKYHHSYPMRRFRNLDSVRCWIESFVEWYNSEHRHSGIKYVTPNQRHFGEADAICAVRQQTYSKALMENPRRWSRPPRCWKQPESVKINYPRPGT
jgi:transposase InsO family protein